GPVEEPGNSGSVADPEITRAGPGGESWNVTVNQVFVLGCNNSVQMGIMQVPDPQSVEVAVAIDGVSQQVRMIAIVKQQSICLRGSENYTHLVLDKDCQRSFGA